MTANAVASGTVLSDALGMGSKLTTPRVKSFILIPLAFGATVMIIAGGNPIQLIVSAQALIVLVAPFVGVILVLLSSRRTLMGRLVNGPIRKSIGVLGIVILLAMSGQLVLSWIV